MGLKELQAWNLVHLKHKPGDRRDYFTTPDDLWEILRTLAEERKKREVDPTLSMLRETLLEKPTSEEERHAQARMEELHRMIEMLTGWYTDVRKLEMKDRLSVLPGARKRRFGDETPQARDA